MFGELLAIALAGTQPSEAMQDRETESSAPVQTTTMVPDVEPRVARPDQWARNCKPWDDWEKPSSPFKIYGNTFYVGTCGIAVIFVAGEHGTVLIDTGTEKGMWLAMQNIARIGHDPTRIGLLLYSHEHFDHVGGMAAAQIYTGAPVLAHPEAAEVLRTGKEHPRDPQAGLHEQMRPAPHVIAIEPGQPVTFGNIAFTPIATPGHSPGALSWQWESCEADDCKSIVYADSLSPISRDDYKFSDHPEYVAKYRAGLDKLAKLECDILLTPHPSHSQMVKRAATGSLVGGVTCEEYAAKKHRDLDERLAKEKAGQ